MASPPTAYATAVTPPGKRPHDIAVFGCTGNAGRAVAYHAIKSSAASSKSVVRVALAGRSRDKVEQVLRGIRDELRNEGVPNDDVEVDIVVADASDDESMLRLARSTKVLVSCAGPYGRYGEAAVRACVEGGAHYCDITGEVPWVERMISDYGGRAEEAGVALCPFSGYDCVPAELGLMLVGKALEMDGVAKMRELSLNFRGKGGGFPRGTLETVLDGFDGKGPQRRDGDVRFYPKEYRATAKEALSPLALILPKWSDQLGLYTGPNVMSGINVPVLCRAAPTLGFSSDLSISDRSVVSGRPSLLNGYGLFPTQLYISALFVGGMALALPPMRWWLRNKLQTYSFGGDSSGKVFLDAYGRSACKKSSATAQCVFPGDAGIYATGLFAVGVANALLEATSAGSKHPPPLAGFHSPVAALHGCRKGLLVDHLMDMGAKIKVKVIPEEEGTARELDRTELRARL